MKSICNLGRGSPADRRQRRCQAKICGVSRPRGSLRPRLLTGPSKWLSGLFSTTCPKLKPAPSHVSTLRRMEPLVSKLPRSETWLSSCALPIPPLLGNCALLTPIHFPKPWTTGLLRANGENAFHPQLYCHLLGNACHKYVSISVPLRCRGLCSAQPAQPYVAALAKCIHSIFDLCLVSKRPLLSSILASFSKCRLLRQQFHSL